MHPRLVPFGPDEPSPHSPLPLPPAKPPSRTNGPGPMPTPCAETRRIGAAWTSEPERLEPQPVPARTSPAPTAKAAKRFTMETVRRRTAEMSREDRRDQAQILDERVQLRLAPVARTQDRAGMDRRRHALGEVGLHPLAAVLRDAELLAEQ